VIIPDNVTSIGGGAFSDCSSLTSVTFGNSVTSIGYSAFSGCSGLTSVIIPDSMTSIGDRAFQDCSSLNFVKIGNSVTSIGVYAFDGCKRMTSVTIDGVEINLPDGNKTLMISLLVEKDYYFTLYSKILSDVADNLIFQMYASGLDEKGTSAYISEKFSAMFPVLINMNNTEILRKILDSEKFITKKNIDDLIRYAIDQQKHQIQLMLMNYKQRKNWYQNIDDIDKKFKL